jgi:hypothetical protein
VTGTLLGYAGDKTRRVQGDVANLIHGRDDAGRDIFRPHTWILNAAFVHFPLSIWLEGGKTLEKHPNATPYRDDWLQKSTFEKEEVINGLHCFKIRSETLNRDKNTSLNSVRFVWLAPDRNYLPIKTAGYAVSWNRDLPIEVGEVSDFREIAPGIWLPFRCSTKTYDGYSLGKNKAVLSNTWECIIDKASLEPNYDVSLFEDIPFPDDAVVYEIKNGKIIDSYLMRDGPTIRRPWIRWMAFAAAALFLGLGTYYAIRWTRTRGKKQVIANMPYVR